MAIVGCPQEKGGVRMGVREPKAMVEVLGGWVERLTSEWEDEK
jgi:hypothetical protein